MFSRAVKVRIGLVKGRLDPGDRAALHAAASEGHRGVVRILLNAGADHTIVAKWGTPLKEAIDDQKPEAEAVLREFGARE